MYQPPHFREERLDVLQNLIRTHPFAAMVTVGDGGLVANHFPFVIDPSQGPFGTLRAHMSRANTQWQDLDGSREALVIFQGTDTYITPSWYPSKAEAGKAVPTWNYALVHAHGRPRAIHDPEWLLRHVSELTSQHESGRAGRLRGRAAEGDRWVGARDQPDRGEVESQPEPAGGRPRGRGAWLDRAGRRALAGDGGDGRPVARGLLTG